MGPDHRGEAITRLLRGSLNSADVVASHAAAVHASPFECLKADSEMRKKNLLHMHFDTMFACNTAISNNP